ncbi:MAG: sarcosine oxidase subunit gamma [Methylophaga sp.]|jgi:sarcosine oxidase, subunit gamma|uniref:sarcosine oxidase subunit gamma n=1 Tax=Methylophaga sp. TaxID=2024840 RepID=UPI000C0E03EE|nr:sarcosine oxidase subunit gamma [Methylophaga sp.]MBL1457663.1 sarcosine oxidase subunit gamma [Methylophaga sp.]MDX1750496.1 sarcosine oxidase subunit gamma [Methylophaga sp.]
MQNVVLQSPVAFAQTPLKPEMGFINGMAIVNRYSDPDVESRHAATLAICDVSCLTRFAIKGPAAADSLKAKGIELPGSANSWSRHDATLVMRLGNSEFLLEDPIGVQQCKELTEQLQSGDGVHVVLRNDASFILSGELLEELLAQVCAINLSGPMLADNQLAMTSIAGVSVVVLRQEVAGQSLLRLWCDGTFGVYLWETLLNIIKELGGGPVGINQFFNSN